MPGPTPFPPITDAEAKLISAIAGARNEEQLLQMAATAAKELSGWGACDVLVSGPKGSLILVGSTHSPEYALRFRLGPGKGTASRAYRSGKRVIVKTGLQKDPDYAKHPGIPEPLYDAAYVAPLFGEKGPVGVFFLRRLEPWEPTEDELARISEIFAVAKKSKGGGPTTTTVCLASDPSCAIVRVNVGRDPDSTLVTVGDVWGGVKKERALDDMLAVTGLDLHIGYFVTRFPACFSDDIVIGTGTYTINRDGDGEFLFAWRGTGSDGAPLDYELRLTGPPSGPWPAVRGQVSSFETAQWELTASGRRAKKVGCQGTGTFDKSTHVRIKARPAPQPFPFTEPFLSRPFAGEFPVSGFYDHEGPGGDRLTWWGESGAASSELNGYVFFTPTGTPLLAAAPGTVLYAGPDGVYACGSGIINDTQLTVAIEHTAPNGEVLITHFRMLSRIDVNAGDLVAAGETIGLSGGH
ncbi:MAG: peptidoglycan DD-metalloendopeptidase family protein, partial [Armatimonadetes bacterium]|nr:peptidoglycan DD-metalloendopeptidase family protein [Armatimonadota bacterium]